MNILCGPFLGDFESEITDFRPYVSWITKVLNPTTITVATHSNRLFLYNWAKTIPIYEDFSRDELNQNGLIHLSASSKDLNLITKKIKSDISFNNKIKQEIVHFNTSYSKSNHWIPIYKKIFNPIDISKEKKKEYMLFIPNVKEKYNVVVSLYEFLSQKYGNIIVAGDMKTHLHEYNIMLKNPTYFKDIFHNMIKLISEAKVVITPNSHWTLLSLLQGTPVISWGRYPNYYQGKTKYQIINTDVSTNNLCMIIENFIEHINNVK